MGILDISKKLKDLYNEDKPIEQLVAEVESETNGFTDDEILEIFLNEVYGFDESELEYPAQRTGHYDEMAFEDYLDARDEDGNYLHPYNIEE